MSIKSTHEIKEGIRKAIHDLGSQQELADRAKLAKSTINRYLNTNREIRPLNYKRLMAVIAKYIDNSENKQNELKDNKGSLPADEGLLLDHYRQLSGDSKKQALKFILELK